jgi:hypothetical protein
MLQLPAEAHDTEVTFAVGPTWPFAGRERIPGTLMACRQVPFTDGLAFAIFYTKIHNRVLAPLFALSQPQAPPQLRAALRAIEHHIDERLAAARLPTAA